MTDKNNEIWDYFSIEVNENNFVNGTGITHNFKDDLSVQISVSSYEFNDGEKNHVPIINVVDDDGKIIHELHANDSNDPETAIENAVLTAESVYKNPGRYL